MSLHINSVFWFWILICLLVLVLVSVSFLTINHRFAFSRKTFSLCNKDRKLLAFHFPLPFAFFFHWFFSLMVMEDNESCGSRAYDLLSPAQSRQQRQKFEVYNEVLRRLKDSNNEEAIQPGFDDELWVHFNRLPTRYL